MRALLLTIALAASAARAQAPDSVAAASRPAELYLGGAVGSVVLAYAASAAANAFDPDDDAGGPAALVALPVGAALGVIASGWLRGIAGSAGGAGSGAVRGALIGYAGAVVAGAAVSALNGGDEAVLLSVIGLATALPVALSVRGYTAAPARLAAPGGGAVGLVVHVPLR
jgi:hypothetical protein